MRREWPNDIDPELQQGLEATIVDARAKYRVAQRSEPEPVVLFHVQTREGLDLAISFELVPDQLNIYFNGCTVLLEYAAHVPKFGKNPRALDDWRRKCLDTVRGVLISDLRIRTRSWGSRTLGGVLSRREGDRWITVGGGGSCLMPFGKSHTAEYPNWIARAG
jgi:hypothetical protein